MAPRTPTLVAVFALAAVAVSAIKINDASGTAANSLILAVREIGEPCKGQLVNAFRHVPDSTDDATTSNLFRVESDGVVSPDGSGPEEPRDPLSMLTRACKASYIEKVEKGISAIAGVSLKYDQEYGYGDDADYGYDELGASDDGYYAYDELGTASDDGYYGQDAYYEGYDELGASMSGKASGSASPGKASGSGSGKMSAGGGSMSGKYSGSASPGKASGSASGSISGFR